MTGRKVKKDMKEGDKVEIGHGVYATVINIFSPVYYHIRGYLRYERELDGLWLYKDALDRYYILLDPRDQK